MCSYDAFVVGYDNDRMNPARVCYRKFRSNAVTTSRTSSKRNPAPQREYQLQVTLTLAVIADTWFLRLSHIAASERMQSSKLLQ